MQLSLRWAIGLLKGAASEYVTVTRPRGPAEEGATASGCRSDCLSSLALEVLTTIAPGATLSDARE
jgi:hypothetical protein